MSQKKRLEKTGPRSKQNLRLWLRLLKVSRIIEIQLREKLRQEFSSTMPRFDVLAALYRFEEGLKMSALSNVLMVSNGNVTGIVDRLVKDGLVIRVPVAGDRRALLVRLTTKGREDFIVQANAHESWVDEMLCEFSSKGGSEFSDQLDELTKSLEERI